MGRNDRVLLLSRDELGIISVSGHTAFADPLPFLFHAMVEGELGGGGWQRGARGASTRG